MSRNYIKTRSQALEVVNAQSRKQKEALRAQKERANSYKKEIEKPPVFHKNRGFILATASNWTLTIGIVLVILNCVGRGFTGTFWYIIPQLIAIIFIIALGSYVPPLNFASDNENFYLPKLNYVYMNLQKVGSQVLTRLGSNLHKKAEQSLVLFAIVSIASSVFGILFYNSTWTMLSIPFLLIYVCRAFIGNTLKENVGKLSMIRYILFAIFIIGSILSIFWKTPVDINLLVLIGMLNSLIVFSRNMYVYPMDQGRDEDDED